MENFIRLYENALSEDFCKNLIEMFEKDPLKTKGVNMYGSSDNKRTTDLIFNHPQIHQESIEWINVNNTLKASLDKHLKKYMLEFNRCFAGVTEVLSDTGFKIMKYDAFTGGFDEHVDVNGLLSCNRFISCLFYLNDVNVGGETKFFYQNISIKPKAGNLLISPSNYTHLHQGCSAESDKYVANTFITYAGL